MERLRMEGLTIKDITPGARAVRRDGGHAGARRCRRLCRRRARSRAFDHLGRGQLVEYPYGTAMGGLNMIFGTHEETVAKNPDLVRAMLKIQRQAAEYMMANKPQWWTATVQKLGANRAAVDQALGAKNVEYVWKLDGTVQGPAKTYAQHMLELKQIRALPEVRDLSESEVLGRDRRQLMACRPERSEGTSWKVIEHGGGDGDEILRFAQMTAEHARDCHSLEASLWRRAKPVVLALIVPLLLLAFWQVATTQQWTRLIPTPREVAEYMVDFAVGGIYDDAYSATLITHLLASMSRVYGGFALAALFALPIGMMVGRLPTARMLLDPFLQVMRPIPVTAWLPLSMILFGLGAKSAFALVCLGAFYPILLNTIFGVRSVDPKLFEAASMLGCRGNAQFYKVVLPAAMPSIFTGLRLGLGLAWFVIVVGEMTGVPQGLGAVIMDARTLSRTDLVICGMIVIGLAGYLSDRVVVMIGNRLLRWSPSHHG
jgi:NitT/TauT family transport system permease protein